MSFFYREFILFVDNKQLRYNQNICFEDINIQPFFHELGGELTQCFTLSNQLAIQFIIFITLTINIAI